MFIVCMCVYTYLPYKGAFGDVKEITMTCQLKRLCFFLRSKKQFESFNWKIIIITVFYSFKLIFSSLLAFCLWEFSELNCSLLLVFIGYIGWKQHKEINQSINQLMVRKPGLKNKLGHKYWLDFRFEISIFFPCIYSFIFKHLKIFNHKLL